MVENWSLRGMTGLQQHTAANNATHTATHAHSAPEDGNREVGIAGDDGQ